MAQQNQPSSSSDHRLRFKAQLLTREDYVSEEQLWRKERVFKTYGRLLEVFAGELLEGGSFLDTGSADGAFAEVCQNHDVLCESIDIDMGVDFEKDPFAYPDGSFRYVNSNSVLEHLRNPENYLREIHRVLEEGGHLFIVTPHWPYAFKEFYDSFTHCQPYSHKSLRRLLMAYGFEPLALVPWLVNKSPMFWRLRPPISFWVAKNLLFFQGTNKWAPAFLKGKSKSLLALAKKICC